MRAIKRKGLIVIMSVLLLLSNSNAQSDSLEFYTKQVQDLFDSSGIVGMSAAIVTKGKVIWKKGYGYSDLDSKKPFLTSTIMNIGSIAKTFTGVCIMKLVEEGKLNLDEDINTYLPFKVVNPNFPNDKITLRQLATHTSGLEDRYPFYEDTVYVYGGKEREALGSFLSNYFVPGGKYYKKENFLPYKPGTFRSYANIATGLAGYIVECVSKKTLAAYSKEVIFKPLDMKAIGWSLKEINTNKHTKLYKRKGTELIKQEWYEGITYPDGGVRTSVEELAKLFIALLNDGANENRRILKKSTTDDMIRFQYTESNRPVNVPSPKKLNSGIYWATKMGGAAMGHNGSDPGVRTFMLADLNKEVGVIIFFNTSMTDEEEIKYFNIYTTLYKLGSILK